MASVMKTKEGPSAGFLVVEEKEDDGLGPWAEVAELRT